MIYVVLYFAIATVILFFIVKSKKLMNLVVTEYDKEFFYFISCLISLVWFITLPGWIIWIVLDYIYNKFKKE